MKTKRPIPSISDAFTCKVFNAGERKTPKLIQLIGDKRKPESAQHVIEFPGGAIEVSRTSQGEYWAHIIVNRGWSNSDCNGLRHAIGKVTGSRIDRADADGGIIEIPNQSKVEQIAVLIAPQN